MTNSKIVEIDADLQDLIPQFLANRKNDISSLEELVSKNDLEAIAQLAHKVKGAAAGYGFHELSQYASQMEQAAKKNDSNPLPDLAKSMREHFERIEVRFVSM
ncbi:Hpt domain protein [compost metagenome]